MTNELPLPTVTSSVDKVMDRLRNLESLVKELRGQLEQAQVASSSNSPGSSTGTRDGEQVRDQSSATETRTLHAQFGRLVVQDSSRSRYISSGFWSRVDDEIDGLKMDLVGDDFDDSEDDTTLAQTKSLDDIPRTPSERNAFLFRSDLKALGPDIHELHPLPLHVPFLLEVFSENVNHFIRTVHIPSVTKMMRESRTTGTLRLSPANEALMFSIYFAAIASMEEDDVLSNFGSSKVELSHKYQLGLERALAKADFLNAPDIVLVQAFANFLCLARRHDSPRWVYMMTGLVIRMAQYLGLQRDGSHFPDLTPFEMEMRRRMWWTICMLDLRASEDQGMDLTIARGTFDTKIPLNINEMDIDPETKQMPLERHGITDMSFNRISAGMTEIMRQMTAKSAENSEAGLEEQSRMLNQIYQKFEQEYLQHTSEAAGIAYWVAVTVARLIMAKMTLIVFLPVLFTAPGEHTSEEIRAKLLVSAIEVAEYNHALNAEEACRQWRWVYQSHTHWHAIVFLLIEVSRRPWSPIVERGWVALHSSWLIPARNHADKNARIWVPLRRLMSTARKHRDSEIKRLQTDAESARRLEMEDEKMPLPSSSGPFASGSVVETFRERWRQLISVPEGFKVGAQNYEVPDLQLQPDAANTSQPSTGLAPGYTSGVPKHPAAGERQRSQHVQSPRAGMTSGGISSAPSVEPFYHPFPTVAPDWSDSRITGPAFDPWLWADADPAFDAFPNLDANSLDTNMDLGGEVNWFNWFEAAKGMDWSG